MKKIIFFILFLCLAGAGVIVWGYQQTENLLTEKIDLNNQQFIEIQSGTTGRRLGLYLQDKGIIKNQFFFPYLLKLHPELAKVKAGVYSVSDIKTLQQLLERFVSGKEAQLSIRFIEGDTYKDWLKALNNAPYLEHDLKGKTEKDIYQLLGMKASDSAGQEKLEGWLYPDTYYYVPHSTELALLKRANRKMQLALEEAWQSRDKSIPLKTPYDMLILSSIVEKESALKSERGKIAQVFYNRMKYHMRLQTDPTVIYGMGDSYKGNITKNDLQTYTPYNTYMIDGLPPTPIAMPTEGSLQAVAHPIAGKMLYFVATGKGGHKFSDSLAQHNQAVQAYLQYLKAQKTSE